MIDTVNVAIAKFDVTNKPVGEDYVITRVWHRVGPYCVTTAVLEHRGGFRVTHEPSGRCFSGRWDDVEEAARWCDAYAVVMADVDPRTVKSKKRRHELAKAVRELAERSGT